MLMPLTLKWQPVFFWKQEQQRKFQTLSMVGSSKKKTNMQRYCNDHWTGTQLSGGVEKIGKKKSSDVSHLREMLLLILMNVLMAWRSTALDPCLSWKMRFWGGFFPVWKVRNLQKNQISQLRILRQFRLKGSSHVFFTDSRGTWPLCRDSGLGQVPTSRSCKLHRKHVTIDALPETNRHSHWK